MTNCRRQDHRETVHFDVVVHWEEGGQLCSAAFRSRDLSAGGMRIEGSRLIENGKQVRIDTPQHGFPLQAIVRYSASSGGKHSMGVEFSAETRKIIQSACNVDHYEVLQLSPRADMDTIHRVFRIMAARFHPDNPESGNPEKFLQLKHSYEVLSDPERRAQFDASRSEKHVQPLPLFQDRAFVDEKAGEANRRLGVLCLLHAQRRRNPERPSISLLELEALMGYPREYLEFTLWYLREKDYIRRTDCSDFALSAAGADFVEEHMPAQSVLNRLIESGAYTRSSVFAGYEMRVQ